MQAVQADRVSSVRSGTESQVSQRVSQGSQRGEQGLECSEGPDRAAAD